MAAQHFLSFLFLKHPNEAYNLDQRECYFIQCFCFVFFVVPRFYPFWPSPRDQQARRKECCTLSNVPGMFVVFSSTGSRWSTPNRSIAAKTTFRSVCGSSLGMCSEFCTRIPCRCKDDGSGRCGACCACRRAWVVWWQECETGLVDGDVPPIWAGTPTTLVEHVCPPRGVWNA